MYPGITNITSQVNNFNKINFSNNRTSEKFINENSKKDSRINSRKSETEAQTEERILVKNPIEGLKEGWKDDHAL